MGVSLGMIVRADFGRGLANQTYSFWKHLNPDVTVLVDMSGLQGGYKWSQDLTAYPGSIVTQWKGYTANFENPEALDALKQCDIIYSAETYYDPEVERLPTILHVNPEFYRGETATQLWYPTGYLTDKLPPGEIIPTPIDDDDIAPGPAGKGLLLHVGGHAARMDRNGARIVHGLLNRTQHKWRLTSQDGMKLNPRLFAKVEVMGNVEDRWDLYEGAGILVYPRRYGGQSLQVNEAMARGMAVIMGSHSPNLEWPIVPIMSAPRSKVATPGGVLDMYMTSLPDLEKAVAELMDDDELLEAQQMRSLEWAHANAWSQWKPRLEALIGG